MAHRFQTRHADRLLSPQRRSWQDPEEILDWLAPGPGDTLIDHGCGPGFLCLPAARRVGPEGLVLGLDVSPEMLRRLAALAQAEGIGNILPLRTGPVHLPFATEVADHALMVNVLHEISNPVATLRDLWAALRPGGRLLVVEWRDDQEEPGPPAPERLSPERVAEWALTAGFALDGEGHLAVHHRAQVFRRALDAEEPSRPAEK